MNGRRMQMNVLRTKQVSHVGSRDDHGRDVIKTRESETKTRQAETETETFAVLVTTSTHKQFSFIDI